MMNKEEAEYTNLSFKIMRMLRRNNISSLDRYLVLRFMKSKRYKRVLDVGCGDCSFLKKVKEMGIVDEVWGLDLNPIGSNGIKVIRGNAEKRLPFEDEYFDAVFCFHLLEHLNNYETCLREIRRILRRGGEVFILVPKEPFRGLSTVFYSALITFSKRKLILPWHIHRHRFTLDKIRRIIGKYFRIKNIFVLKQDFIGILKSYFVWGEKI